jgi:cell division protein FtsA
MQSALIGGLFLAGGGARLDGMCDLAERILQCQARIALPLGIQDWPEEIFDPVWTTAAGLAMYSAKLKSQHEIQRQSIGLLGRILK